MKSAYWPLMGRGRSRRPGSVAGTPFGVSAISYALAATGASLYYSNRPTAVLVYAVSQWRSSSVKGSVEFRVA
jgi:hypothetical protein